MKKGMKRTLLAFMVMAMLASSAAVPAMASDGENPTGGGISVTVLADSNGEDSAETRENGQNVAQIGDTGYADFASAWSAAMSAQSPVTIELLSNVTVNSVLSVSGSKNITIDLGGYTLTNTSESTSYIKDGATLVLTNGNIEYNDLKDNGKPANTMTTLQVQAGSTLTLNGINLSTNCTGLMARGDAAALNVINSTVTGATYGIGTNAGEEANYHVKITLQGSEISVTEADNCAVLFNVPGQLNIDDCTITGTRQGVLLRAGTAYIQNSDIRATEAWDLESSLSKGWGTGNVCTAGALVVGNYQPNPDDAKAYKSADCTVVNSTLSYTDSNDPGYGVYVYGNGTEDNGKKIDASLNMTNTRVNGDVSTNNESTTDLNDTTIVGDFTSDAKAKVNMDGGTNVTGDIKTDESNPIEKTYTVSFEGIGEQEYAPNATLRIPDAPSISGASGFIGWSDGNRIWLPGETYTVTGNVTFKALFETVPEEEEETYIPSTPISDGWHHYSSGSMYYQDGKRTRGWADIDGARYYFDEKGFMATGWTELEDGWYYFAEDGKMATGWLQLGNTWYYLDPATGRMYDNGLATIGKYTYYFYDWGGMANSWWYEDGEGGWYFFGGDGAMKAAQWLEWKGEWYYLTETGKMAVSTDIGGYTVNADGVWVH